MGRDERRAPLKTPAWEAKAIMSITRNKAKKRENTHTHTLTYKQTKKVLLMARTFEKKKQCLTLRLWQEGYVEVIPTGDMTKK